GAAVTTWSSARPAQSAAGVRRIGLLGSARFRPVESFRRRLRDLGFVEGKTLTIDYRFAEGRDERYVGFATELVMMPVEAIMAGGTPAALAAKAATAPSKIPVVVVAGDVVNTGIVSNLARPEANITGFIAVNVELEAKRLELLKEMIPG